jgi:hypothetical protein
MFWFRVLDFGGDMPGPRAAKAVKRFVEIAHSGVYVVSINWHYRRLHMVRFVRSAVIFAGILVASDPLLADPSAVLASSQVASVSEQSAAQEPASSVPVWKSSSDAIAPAGALPAKNAVPVGFGWG